MNRMLLVACAATAVAAGGGVAQAQTINYGQLEQLFGEPVTTSATGKPQRISEAPANMVIITADDIRRSGATTIGDLPTMVLKNYPGIDVTQNSFGGVDVAIHGYNQPLSPKLLVLVNGRQVYLDHYGFTSWPTIPVELAEIRQVEVVKGPATALFGFNAATGVINIVTYSPLYDTVNEVGATGGTQSYAGGSAVATMHLGDRFGTRLSAGGYRADQYDGWSRQSPTFGARRPGRTSFSADSLFQVTPNIQAGLELTHSSADMIDVIPTFSPLFDEYQTWSVKGSVAADTTLGLINTQLYHNDLSYKTTVAGAGLSKNDVTVAQVNDVFKLGADHTLRPGVEYRRNEVSGVSYGGGQTGYQNYAASLMWDWQARPDLEINNAVRVDRLAEFRTGNNLAGSGITNNQYDRSLTAFSFNSGLVYKLTDNDSVRLTAGRSIEAPSLVELALQFVGRTGPLTTAVVGNPRLNPTIVNNYEIGYSHDFPNQHLKLSSSLFYSKLHDLKNLYGSQLLNPSTRTFVLSAASVGDSEEVGLEVGLEAQYDSGLRWGANYSFAGLKDHINAVTPVRYDKLTPQHKINLHLGYTLGSWELDGYGHYISNITSTTLGGSALTQTRVPSYVELDARVGYQITPTLRAAVTGTSINLSTHNETSGPSDERRVLVSIAKKF